MCLVQVLLLMTLSIFLFTESILNFTFLVQKLFAKSFPKSVNLIKVSNKNTASKVFKCGCFPDPCFPVFALNMGKHSLQISENNDRKNSIFGHFSQSENLSVLLLLNLIMLFNYKGTSSQAPSEAITKRCSKKLKICEINLFRCCCYKTFSLLRKQHAFVNFHIPKENIDSRFHSQKSCILTKSSPGSVGKVTFQQ